MKKKYDVVGMTCSACSAHVDKAVRGLDGVDDVEGSVEEKEVVKDLDDISICTLTSKDVVRHPLVQKIVKAYEDYEKKSARPRENRRKK